MPATVTCCSCIACSSADWVRGLARLISSAISSWAKTGPAMKRKLRLPPGLSSSTSVPRMSDGIRSGVNWMRRASMPSTIPIVSTSLVLARPGTPTSRAWPPDRMVIRARSTTRSWPKMTLPMPVFAARTFAAVDSAARTIISSSFSMPSAPDTAISPAPVLIWSWDKSDSVMQQLCQPYLIQSLGPAGRFPARPQAYDILAVGAGRLHDHEGASKTVRQLCRIAPIMAKEMQSTAGLNAIAGAAKQAGAKGPPPVHLWNPPFCGDLDMRIAADGTWFYLKTPIGRPALVKLFASVLKREGDKYFLVTPVEKCGIRVDDVPFMAVELRVDEPGEQPALHFRTNVDDWVACGAEHALRFEPEPETGGLRPYLHVRSNLWARVKLALFYDLVELGEERDVDGVRMFGVASAGSFFPMAPADSLKDLL